MELSCSNIKKILTFFSKETFFYILEKSNFLIFPKNGNLHLQTQTPKNYKKTPEKNSLYFWKWNFLAQILKKFLYFLKRKLFLYSPKRKLFLYFRKWNFLAQIIKNFIFSQKKPFLIFS